LKFKIAVEAAQDWAFWVTRLSAKHGTLSRISAYQQQYSPEHNPNFQNDPSEDKARNAMPSLATLPFNRTLIFI
jgi:hypothetical protein